ncbi:MAG: aldose epimerase family protein [Paracoccaceae bacterium]
MSATTTGTVEFGRAPDGSCVPCIGIGAYGMRAELISWGASLKSLHVDGTKNSLVVELPTFEDYRREGLYVGAIVGRFANRIKNGHISLSGRDFDLDRNEGNRHLLHGGSNGTGVRNWRVANQGENWVQFDDSLPDGHMGFPGNLDISVRYSIESGPTLRIEMQATTDQETLCSFAPHSYFNLDGGVTTDEHRLQIDATRYLPVDSECIPSGEIFNVGGTRFDLQLPVLVSRILSEGGLDHNFCISGDLNGVLPTKKVARLSSSRSGIVLEIASNQPGLQVYDGRSLYGKFLHAHCGVALEPQGWPDSIHHSNFPSAVLRPGMRYFHVTEYRVGSL